MKIRFRRRLVYRQARNTIIFALLLGVTLSGIQIGLDILKERERIDSTITQVLDVISQPASHAAYQLDGWLAKNVVDGLKGYQAIRAVSLVDNFGTTLGHWSRPETSGRLKWLVSLVFGRELTYSLPLHHPDDPEPVGRLEVKTDSYLLAWNFIDRAGVTLIGGAVRDGCLAVLLALIFYYTITRPLLRIYRRLSVVDPASPEKGRVPVPAGHEQDEMGLLARTVNTLLAGFGRSLARSRAAEKEVQERETRLRTVMENVPHGILTINETSQVESLNTAAENLFGYPDQSMVGLEVVNLVGQENRKALEEVLAAYRATHDPSVLVEAPRQVAGRRRDGATVPVELIFKEMRLDARRLIVCVATDITERLKAESELREIGEQLLQSQKMEAVGTLASGIAHDFNNLLQVISGYTQLMTMADGRDGRGRDHVDKIDGAVERAAELVQRLLTFSRKVKPELAPLDLNHEVSQAVGILERTIPKMIRIRLNLAADLKAVSGDPYQIEQVVMNLGANARDAMPDGGRLAIETENLRLTAVEARSHGGLPPGDYVRLTVSDTGLGMDKDTVDHMFEPFFTTKEVGRGTGLGLAVVYGIIVDHGGRIFCRSRLEGGTVFEVLLPALTAEEAVGGVEPEASLSQLMGEETILVVDDERAITDVAQDLLGQYGYRVLTAGSGEEALEMYAAGENGIDLVVLDLGMPGMGGLRCLEELLTADPTVRVVVASGYQTDEWKDSSRNAGAAGFVGKPYRMKDLLTEVRRVLDARS